MVEQTHSGVMLANKPVPASRPCTVEILVCTAVVLVTCIMIYLVFFEGHAGF